MKDGSAREIAWGRAQERSCVLERQRNVHAAADTMNDVRDTDTGIGAIDGDACHTDRCSGRRTESLDIFTFWRRRSHVGRLRHARHSPLWLKDEVGATTVFADSLLSWIKEVARSLIPLRRTAGVSTPPTTTTTTTT